MAEAKAAAGHSTRHGDVSPHSVSAVRSRKNPTLNKLVKLSMPQFLRVEDRGDS